MKLISILTPVALVASLALRSAAQTVYSDNIVGYYNLTLLPGDNLIANELDATDANGASDNTINNVLNNASPGLPAGSTFTEWNSAAGQLMPLSVYNGSSWSINYTLGPDETGAVLHLPVGVTLTLAGNVDYTSGGPDAVNTYVPPVRGPGVYLLGYAFPQQSAMFQDIIGRAPVQGDWVETLDPSTQTYTTTTFENGQWNNGDPSIPLGDAAYFGLAETPEPSVYAMAAMGAALLIICRKRGQRCQHH